MDTHITPWLSLESICRFSFRRLGCKIDRSVQYKHRHPIFEISPRAVKTIGGIAVALFCAIVGLILPISVLPALGIAGMLAIVIATKAIGRLLMIIFGALFVFQSSSAITAPKLAYFSIFLSCWFVAVFSIVRSGRGTGATPRVDRLLIGSGLLLGYLVFTAFNSTSKGTPLLVWSRDALPLIMMAAVPTIAADLKRAVSSRFYERLLVVVGMLCAISLAVDWASRRGFSSIPVDRIFFATIWPALLLISYCIAQFASRRSSLWLVLGSFTALIMLISGSRGLLVGIAVLVISSFRSVISKSEANGATRVLKLAVIVSLCIAAAVFLAPKAGLFDAHKVTDRLTSVVDIGTIRSTDLSYEDRAAQSREAIRLIKINPFFGAGPGHAYTFEYISKIYGYKISHSMDSPLAFVAENGIFGVAILLAFASLSFWLPPTDTAKGGFVFPEFAVPFVFSLLSMIPLLDLSADRGLPIAILLMLVAPTRVPDRTLDNSSSLSFESLARG